MGYVGVKPSAVPLTSADIADSIITSAKIVDATIANADIANSTINLTTKVTGTLPVANGGTGLTALGSASQVLRTNSGATALEFATLNVSSGAFSVYDMSGVASGTLVLTNTFLNDGTNYNTANGRYTAPSTGKYFFTFHALSSSGGNDLYFEKNGSGVGAGTDYGYTPNGSTIGTQSIILNLTSGDYVTILSTGNVYANYISFSGFKIY